MQSECGVGNSYSFLGIKMCGIYSDHYVLRVLAQDRDRWWALVSTVRNLRVSKMQGIS
jgi:hypothetical protein